MITPEFVLQNLNEYRKSGQYCDVTFNVDGKLFQCHRAVLIGAVSYFEAMFRSKCFAENESDCIELKYLDRDGFEILLEYIYTGHVALNMNILKQVLLVASYFHIDCLMVKCFDCLMSNIDNSTALDYYFYANTVGYEHLTLSIVKYIERNFTAIVEQKDFYEIPFAFLKQLVCSDDVYVDSEQAMLDVVVRWIKHDPENRVRYKSELIRNIRFAFISPDFFNLVTNDNSNSTTTYDRLFNETIPENAKRRNYNNDLFIFAVTDVDTVSKVVSFSFNGVTINEHNDMIRQIDTHNIHAVSLNSQIYMYTSNRRSWINTFSNFDKESKSWISRKNLDTIMPALTPPFSMVSLNRYNSIYANIDLDRPIDYNVYCYNAELNDWTTLDFYSYSNNRGYSIHRSVLIDYENELYSFGGDDPFHHYAHDVLRYDPRVGHWSAAENFSDEGAQFVCGVVLRNRVYLIGIEPRSIAADMMYIYDLVAGKWEPKQALPMIRLTYSMAAFDKHIYIIWKEADYPILEIYEPESDSWIEGPQIGRFTGKTIIIKQ